MRIALPVHIDGGYKDVVDAELLFDIAPHLAHVATFALHRGSKLDTLFARYWFVSNVETGGRVSYEYDRDDAIHKARITLASKSPRDVLQAYSRATKHGCTR